MRALLQRVKAGSVTIKGQIFSSIGHGLVILLGVGQGDSLEDMLWIAKKTANLRIFSDQDGKMNLSLLDIGGEALVVSQFTLYADCKKGQRPGFGQAADPQIAQELYQQYIEALKNLGIKVCSGVFQADMLVNIDNDGPVTILLEH